MTSLTLQRLTVGAMAGLLLTAAPCAVSAQESGESGEQPAEASEDDNNNGKDGATKDARRREQERAALESIEVFLRGHVDHANSGDLDAYMNDFVDTRNDKDLLRAYAERVMRDHHPEISLGQVELESLRRDRAKVRVIQVTRWVDEDGRARSDRVLMRYSLKKLKPKDGAETWRIIGTTRQRDDE